MPADSKYIFSLSWIPYSIALTPASGISEKGVFKEKLYFFPINSI